MEIIIQSCAQESSISAAKLIAKLIREKPNAVLGLATGRTPIPLYQELIRLHREEGLDFSRVTTFNLDEYLGLHPEHPASYHLFMHENFFSQVNIPSRNIHIPDGTTLDVPAHCQAYEEAIRRAGGIDLQLLGIGSDGHIGFNEPTSSLASRTRIKTLTKRTRQDNAHFFSTPEEVPQHVITMGIGTILEARHLIVLAFGSAKANAVAAMVEGPITAMVPASVLQMHRIVTALIDEPASTKLQKREYYQDVFAEKPSWQRG